MLPAMLGVSCHSPENKYELNAPNSSHNKPSEDTTEGISAIELEMIHMGLTDIQNADTNIQVDIRYSTTDNFLKTDIYGEYDKAYLQAEVADKLKIAQAGLAELQPGYSLVVFDAARPLIFQKMIWDSLKLPVWEKGKFASNPARGSLHNFGAAVDLSILDEEGKELDMGTPYDFMGALAYPVMETKFLADGSLTQQQVDNRKLLRQVMHKAGFFNIQTEWWHFNSCTRAEAWIKYKIIE